MKASASITISHVTDGLTTHYEYAKNESNITAPSVGWSPTVPASEVGKFIWRREGQALAGETPSTWSTPVCLTGAKGDQGTKGETKDYPIIPQFTWKGKGSTPENLVSFEWSSSGNYPGGLENPTIDSTASGTAGGYWNNASGQPLDIGIKAHDDFELEEVRVRIVSGYGNPSMKVMYHNGTSWVTLQTFATTADSTVRSYLITSPVKAKLWKILFENNNWTGLSNLRVIGTLHSVIGPSGEVGSPGAKGDPGTDGDKGDPGVGILAVTAEYISHTSSTSLNDLDEESEWTPEPPERGFGEYIWMRTIIYYDNNTSSMTEPVCITGDRGPVGKTGEVGVYVESNTLYVKGFNEDGELTEESGFLFTSNARYLVQSTEYLLTGGGVGYIGLSSGEVLVLKLNPQVGHIEWLDYNTGIEKFPDIIFGKIDKKVSGVIDISLITPSSTSEFITSHFMTIMANAVDGTDISTEAGRDEVQMWADALGISQFFESIAVLDAFIGRLFSNEITMSKDGVIESSNYEESGGVPTEGYRLLSQGGIIKAVLAILQGATLYDAIIKGRTSIECEDGDVLFKTQFGSAGTGSYTVPAKARWSGALACGSVAVGSSGAATWGGSSATYNSYYRSNANNRFKILDVPALQTKSYTIQESGDYLLTGRGYVAIGDSATCSIYFNNTLVWRSSGPSGSSSSVYNKIHYLTSGTVVKIELVGNAGGTLEVAEDLLCIYKGSTNAITAFKRIHNSTLLAYSTALTLGSSFNSASSKNLASVDAWYNSLVNGQTLDCTSSSVITYNGTTYTVRYVTRTSGMLRIVTTNNMTIDLNAPAGTSDPANKGWHNITGTIYPAGETRGVLTANIIPTTNQMGVGSPANKFKEGYFVTLYADLVGKVTGEVNASGTSNKVWGAVAN